MAAEVSDTDSDNLQFELLLIETGRRLLLPPPSSADHLISLLDEAEICLSKVDQKPSKSMQNALSNLMKALVAKHLLSHSDEDVRVSVASCICELTRITAPDTPYDDHQMKEVFKLIVSSLKNLSLNSSRSYSKRTCILRNVATLRLCLVMLDLDCDALIIEMFQHFVNAMRDCHPKNVFSYMEMIMIHVLKESENISMELLFPFLLVVKRDNKEVLPIAQNLVGRVLASSASKLKPYLIQAVKDSGLSLCHYSEIVASICQGTSGIFEQNDATTNDHKEDKAIPKESGSAKQVDLASDESPKLIVSDPVMQTRKDETLADSNSLKKVEHDHLADEPINVDLSISAEADYLGTEKVVNSEFESDAKNRLTKSNLESTEPSENLYIYEKEVETGPDYKKDSKDLPGSSNEDLSMDGTVSLQKQKGTCIQPSNLECIKPTENCYICIKDVEALPDHSTDDKDAPGASYEDPPIEMAVSLQNEKETGIRPSLKFAEASENFYIYETLLDHKRDSEDAPDSLEKDLSISGAVSLQNDKETAIVHPTPEEKEDEVSNLTFSIPSGTVPDAQPRREDSMIKETTPAADSAFRKASEGTSDSEPKQNKCFGEQVAAVVSKEEKTPTDIDESKKENSTATPSKATSLKQSLKKLCTTSKIGDGLSSKHLELKKERAEVKYISGKDGTKSSTWNDNKKKLFTYGENPVGFKVNIYWPKDQIGQVSATPQKVQSAEPSDLHTSVVKGTVNSNLVIHINNGQPKKRKSVASRASDRRKRVCYNAVEKTHNTLDEMSPSFKFKTTHSESSNETTLYQKCLEEVQEFEGLFYAEFAKAVNFLKDDRNAIAFTTIKGPRRLIWLRSLWQHCQHCNPKH